MSPKRGSISPGRDPITDLNLMSINNKLQTYIQHPKKFSPTEKKKEKIVKTVRTFM